MADEKRTPSSSLSLEDDLLKEPYSFGFFYAMRRLECLHPEWPRLGKAPSPVQEPIRLGQDCSMEFAPSTITSCGWEPDSENPRLGVAFLGLFGPNGPLPLHLTDYALERARRHKDRTFLRFADVFHHRLLCLFYRGWASAQPAVSFDRPREDRFGEYVASLCGLGLPSLRNRDAMLDVAKLYFAGHLQCVAKNADGLAAIIGGYFRVAVAITEFVGEWLEISPQDRCMLGASPKTGTLGVTAIAGAYAFECQHKFRVHIGPVGLVRFEQLLPGGEGLAALVAVVRNYVGDEYVWDLQLILRKEEVPALRLGAAARLGWTSWLGIRPTDEDADDLILNPFRQC
ncbi:MAG: type VI secretion system baseplate subunit TssG [Chromatiaceae bacterium]|nr:type VI secretion system baseplate subunit TssG [Chromatiaceae bacterium]